VVGFPVLLIHEPDCHHVIEYAQTEAFLRFENPMQVIGAITHPEFSGDSRDVIFTNVLNETQRLNAGTIGTGLSL